MITRIFSGIWILLLAIIISACSTVEPNAGEQSVLIKKPMFFGAGGIDPTPVNPGLVYTAVTTTGITVNMQPRQQVFTFDDLFTKDGVPLDFVATVQYQIVDSVKLVRDFGADDGPHGMGFFIRVLDQPFRALVRDAVKKHGLNEMAINVSAAEQVDEEVTARFTEVIAKSGVPIRLISVTLGRANPPDAIKHQRIATAEQEQRQKTEQQAKLAEDQRKMHEESRAAADRAYNDKMGLNAEQFVTLRQLDALRQVCGNGNCTFYNGDSIPLLGVKR